MRPTASVSRLAPFVLFVALVATAGTAHAFEPFAFLIPCRTTATNSVGTERTCITCHNNADGGAGCAAPPCFNPFGTAFSLNGRVWNRDLAILDSDDDTYSNGDELGDPEGLWRPSMGIPSYCDCATRPGQATFTPGDADGDMDGYCCIGQDLSSPPNGTCRDPGERNGQFDCDDMNPLAHSGREEICSNLADNDCDGLPTLLDPDCASVVDRDGDGFCPMGRDLNGDGNCISSAAEMTADMDCDDNEPTVYPGAQENCADGLDNNCNGFIDRADPQCTSDVDVDMDGYCPIGRDLNSNGNCNDPGELDAGLDCNDMNAAVNSGATEICGDGIDNDCDGLIDFRDTEDCAGAYDFDGDGYCAVGQDLEPRDRYCTTAEELALPGDCDDTDPLINPAAMEICTNAIDNNCDGRVGIADPQCIGFLDRDGDRYCPVGFDMNRNGNCTDPGEETGNGDCDDDNALVNPAAMEVCTDGIDNDCNGVADALDRRSCLIYRDHDGDGWCIVGRDLNGDGDCDDAGEQEGPTEVPTERDPVLGTDLDPTVYPGAPENCLDRKDNDLNGIVDDPEVCTRDRDGDGDGYCPIGQDLNGDGDCLDEGENLAVSDCNDMDPNIHPGAMEMCLEMVDLDCDGDWGKNDDDCAYLLDRDGDGFCPIGIDDNGDGDCDDADEDRFGMDCDDRNPLVNPRAMEICDDGIDNDCNGLIDYADGQCVCTDVAQCDDGDPCTRQACVSGRCTWTPDSACGDAGMPDGGLGTSPASCACRAAGGGGGGRGAAGVVGWLLIAVVLTLRRRRRAR